MTATMLRLRPYQRKALDTVRASYDHVRRQAVVAATGAGKTVVLAHLADAWITHDADTYVLPRRVLILVHRDELVHQTLDKLRQVAPGLTLGVIKGAQNDTGADIIVASVQTLAREGRRSQLGPVGLVIVDECHHCVGGSTYHAVLEHVGCFYDGPYANLKARAVGFTATLSRGPGSRGDLGDVWEEATFRIDILDLIEMGFLVDVVGRRVTIDGLTFENVVKRGGDFAPASMSEALRSADAMRVTADAYLEYAADRSGVVFTPDVASAQEFAEEFRGRGLKTEAVWGAMPMDARRDVLRRFSDGDVQVITNASVLTEGWDAPIASCCVMARPTLSAVLYTQAIGRVLRPYPGKTQALVLDVAGASEMHQLATLADLTSRRMEEIPEGESLTQAVQRERRDGNVYLQNYVLDSYEVDLFRRAEALWLQTKAGVWFTTAGDGRENARLFFLWPGSEPGLYRAGWRWTHKKGGGWIADNVPFNIAQEWAEQAALEYDRDNPTGRGASLARKNARWRTNRQPASDEQIGHAQRLKLPVTNGMTRREVSDMISVEYASRALDGPLTKTR